MNDNDPSTDPSPSLDHRLRCDGGYQLRPAKPMSRSEFDKRCRWYDATSSPTAHVPECVTYAAYWGLVLEAVAAPRSMRRGKGR